METPVEILFIEDDPYDIQLFFQFLPGYRFTVIGMGDQALEYVKAPASIPTIVLLDINLPRVSGKDILKAMRANPAFSEVPIIIMTSSTWQRDIDDCVALGATEFITKPFTLDALKQLTTHLKEFIGLTLKTKSR